MNDEPAATAAAAPADVYQATEDDEHAAPPDTVSVMIEVVPGNFTYIKPEPGVEPWEVTSTGVNLMSKDHRSAAIRYLTERANDFLARIEESHAGVIDRVVWSSGRRRAPPWMFTMHIQNSQPVAKVAEALVATKLYIPCSLVNTDGDKVVEELGFRVQKTKIRDPIDANVEKQTWTLRFRSSVSRFAVVKEMYDRIHHLAFPVHMFEISDDGTAYRVLPPWTVQWTYEMSWDPIRGQAKRGRQFPPSHFSCVDTKVTPRPCRSSTTATRGPYFTPRNF